MRTLPSRLVARPWLLAFVPINAATSGFGVALPLLILLPLGGTWSEVAFAATLFNAVLILASIGWGFVCDRYPSRRNLLLLNFAGFAAIYAALARADTVAVVIALYAVVGALAPAGATASNLLVLERFTAADRPAAYASLQEMSMIGSIAGLLGGYVWLVAGAPLGPLFYLLSVLALVSVVAVALGVRDGPRTARQSAVARHPESLVARLHPTAFRIVVPFFPLAPRWAPGAVRRLRRWIREEVHAELPLILVASVLFNFAANLFNISYVPYLNQSIGLSAAAIFLVNLSNNTAQALSFPASGTMSQRLGADALVQRASYLRSLGYLGVALFTFAPAAVAIGFGVNVIAFALLGLAIAFFTTASSMILFRALEGRDAGRLLGFSSALGGAAAVGGAIASGILSVIGSYQLVFLVAGACVLVSLPLWSAAQVAHIRRTSAALAARSGRPERAPAAQTD